MFTAYKQEAYLKGFKNVDAGEFEAEDGRKVAYDAYHQVIMSVFNKNGELVDVKCRLPNSEEGEKLYVALRNLNLMTKMLIDVEIQISKAGSAKYFITKYEVCK